MSKAALPTTRFLLVISLLLAAALLRPSEARAAEETAIFAGGCFWCVEADFDYVPGVLSTISGYIGGDAPNPTYAQVSAGGTGYYEAVKITFNPDIVSYEKLLDTFWRSVDPTDAGGQFCDRGDSYKTAIFTLSDAQKEIATQSKVTLQRAGQLDDPIVTVIRTATAFYPAEDYHQDYYARNPVRYKYYRFSCGRDARIADLWGKEAHRGILPH